MALLPAYGEWHLSNPLFGTNPPFAVLTVDFLRRRGTARYLRNTTDLTSVVRMAPDRFGATYAIGATRGLFEAQIDANQLLAMTFIGAVRTECTARPIEGRIFGVVRVVPEMGNAEKLLEAMKRAGPLLPSETAALLAPMLTPEALEIMGSVTVVWLVSHYFGVGEVVDVILLLAGAAMLGTTAVDTAREFVAFVEGAIGAQSEADLDAAARHFAAAVLKGGLTVVMALMLRGGAKSTQDRLRARAAAKAPRPAAGPRVPGGPMNPRLPPHLEPLKDPIAAARAATTDCEGQAALLTERVPGARPYDWGGRTAAGKIINHTWAVTEINGVTYLLDTSAAQYIAGSPYCTTAPLVQPAQVIGAGLAEAVETGIFTQAQHDLFLALIQRGGGM